MNQALTTNKSVLDWIEDKIALVQPDKVVWITGCEEQLEELRKEACSSGEMIKLNEEKLPAAICTAPPSTTLPVWRAAPSSAPKRKRTPVPPTTGRPRRKRHKMLYDIAAAATRAARCTSSPIPWVRSALPLPNTALS